MIRVVGVELSKKLDTIHELRHACRHVVITVEADGAVSHSFGAIEKKKVNKAAWV